MNKSKDNWFQICWHHSQNDRKEGLSFLVFFITMKRLLCNFTLLLIHPLIWIGFPFLFFYLFMVPNLVCFWLGRPLIIIVIVGTCFPIWLGHPKWYCWYLMLNMTRQSINLILHNWIFKHILKMVVGSGCLPQQNLDLTPNHTMLRTRRFYPLNCIIWIFKITFIFF